MAARSVPDCSRRCRCGYWRWPTDRAANPALTMGFARGVLYRRGCTRRRLRSVNRLAAALKRYSRRSFGDQRSQPSPRLALTPLRNAQRRLLRNPLQFAAQLPAIANVMGGGKADAGLVLAVKIDAGELKLAPVVARTPFNASEQLATAAFPLQNCLQRSGARRTTASCRLAAGCRSPSQN